MFLHQLDTLLVFTCSLFLNLALRKYTVDYTPCNNWIVAFDCEKAALAGFQAAAKAFFGAIKLHPLMVLIFER